MTRHVLAASRGGPGSRPSGTPLDVFICDECAICLTYKHLLPAKVYQCVQHRADPKQTRMAGLHGSLVPARSPRDDRVQCGTSLRCLTEILDVKIFDRCRAPSSERAKRRVGVFACLLGRGLAARVQLLSRGNPARREAWGPIMRKSCTWEYRTLQRAACR
eukprot:scaffold111955_cov36-Tisochrysis_lutea.AAC.5